MNHQPITTETIAAAERLAGVDYGSAERAQVLAKIDEQLDWLRARRRFTPDNALGPATVFDPRLPGVAVVDQSAGFAPRAAAPPPLPGRDADIAFAPLTVLAGWLRKRAITSSRLTAIYLDRLERIGPRLECAVTVIRDLAIAQAAEADREIAAGNYRGPLHGVPWGAMAGIMGLCRSSMLEVLDSEYVKFARVKGLSEHMVIFKHALKNAIIPVLTFGGLTLAGLLNGSVVVEVVFAWPGVGRLLLQGIRTGDFPIVQAAVMASGLLYILTALAVDILYAYVNPRIRYQ